MPILHIEHRVGDFDSWKRRGFDADPVGRSSTGVRRYWITRLTDDPNYVMVDLEFDSHGEAEAMRAALLNLWQSPLVQIGAPTARILELIEAQDVRARHVSSAPTGRAAEGDR
jgi:hypothetical protein